MDKVGRVIRIAGIIVRLVVLDIAALFSFVAAFGHAMQGELLLCGVFTIAGFLALILDKLNNMAPTVQINTTKGVNVNDVG